jgi:hypothetical protein
VKTVYQDMDKRNTGIRLVRVERISGNHAVCTILTAGGRPCDKSTSFPELRGSGAIGETTFIRLDRLHKSYRYRPVS